MQNCLNFARIWFGALLTNDMAQKCKALCSKATFVWVQFEVYFPELVHHYTQVLQMLLLAFAVHIEVINEYLQEVVTQVFKDLRHSSGERTRCILDAEWHDCPIIQPGFSDQSCLLHVFWSHLNLPEARLQVQNNEP
jgi:virulence-associated protein VapD